MASLPFPSIGLLSCGGRGLAERSHFLSRSEHEVVDSRSWKEILTKVVVGLLSRICALATATQGPSEIG